MSEVERLEEVFTLVNLKAWLANKDPDETFDYQNPTSCASAQFAQAHGFPEARAGGDYVRTGEGYNTENRVYYPKELNEAYYRYTRSDGPRTFGHLLECFK